MAARKGETMPKFPIPTHAFPANQAKLKVNVILKSLSCDLFLTKKRIHVTHPSNFGPLSTTTTRNAIADLPKINQAVTEQVKQHSRHVTYFFGVF
jgi:hypothetical protein